MGFEIAEVTENKKAYLDLLLLADEQEDMIDRYLENGQLFVLSDGGVKCAAVVVECSDAACELKNIATYPRDQGKGYGGAMVAYLTEKYLKTYHTMYVGTGDVPRILRFYENCGFTRSHRVPNFFRDNYASPIIEDGVQLCDMVYLRADAKR
ncbi:MAG: GNAT family N-acetyltransferase [Clostridiales bacterium]|nr:GNAT family N-acetyltransferase [Clostridiales bacterium]